MEKYLSERASREEDDLSPDVPILLIFWVSVPKKKGSSGHLVRACPACLSQAAVDLQFLTWKISYQSHLPTLHVGERGEQLEVRFPNRSKGAGVREDR